MLAALHQVSPGLCELPVRPVALPGAHVLQAALNECAGPWVGGPFSEPARMIVCGAADGLLSALGRFDRLAAQVASTGAAPVITHGEPHAGNLVRQGATLLLVDWDTAGHALLERDLWWILSPSGDEAQLYERLTGRDVSRAAAACTGCAGTSMTSACAWPSCGPGTSGTGIPRSSSPRSRTRSAGWQLSRIVAALDAPVTGDPACDLPIASPGRAQVRAETERENGIDGPIREY